MKIKATEWWYLKHGKMHKIKENAEGKKTEEQQCRSAKQGANKFQVSGKS